MENTCNVMRMYAMQELLRNSSKDDSPSPFHMITPGVCQSGVVLHHVPEPAGVVAADLRHLSTVATVIPKLHGAPTL